ncbi:MAG: prephenate dehydrogenase [Coraliomargaritaceae bacterium]
MFEQITILGTGLLGASIAMAARKHRLADRIVVWSRSQDTRAQCNHVEWCDRVADTPVDAVKASQLTVLCTPVQTIVPLLEDIAPALEKGSIVTDVGSTKENICRDAQKLSQDNFTFIGSHPMAGSEQSGMASANVELFQSAACILTPMSGTSKAAVDQLDCFWRTVGMSTHTLTPEQHDIAVAHISHLPHLLSSALCNTLSQKPLSWRQLAGGGLRDTSRIAAGDPSLWQQILIENREAVLKSLFGFEKELANFREILAQKDVSALHRSLSSGKTYREGLQQ